MQKNLTEGSPIKLIVTFTLPIFIGLVFQQFYSMVDSIIVGHYVGLNALAGVGATGSLNFLIIGFVAGLATGFCIPISQAFGANRVDDVKKYYFNALVLTLIFSTVITTITLLFLDEILILLNTPEDIIGYSYDYMFMIFAGTLGIFIYNFLASLLRALGDSKTPLYFLILASILNIVLDLVFIINFEMGVMGAGLATAISQGLSGLLCFILILYKFEMLKLKKVDIKLSVIKIKKLLSIGVPMGLQFSITAIGSIIMTISINELGSFYVACTTAAGKIIMLTVQGLEGLSLSMATFSGQNIGAGKLDRVRQGVKSSLIIGFIYSAVCMIIVYFFGDNLARLFINENDPLLFSTIQQYLNINTLFYFFLAILVILRCTIQGLGYSKYAMLVGLGEMVARSIVALFFVKTYGFNAVLFSNPSAWVIASLILFYLYHQVIKELKMIYN